MEKDIRRCEELGKRGAKKRRLEMENSWQLIMWRKTQEEMKGMSTVERDIHYKKYLAEVDKKRREWTAQQRAAKRAEKEKRKQQESEKRGITPDANKAVVAEKDGGLQSDKGEGDADDSDVGPDSEEEEFDADDSDFLRQFEQLEEEEEYEEGEDDVNGGGVSGPENSVQVHGSDVVETQNGDNETAGAPKDLSEVDKAKVQTVSGDQQSGKKTPEVQDPEVKVPDGNEDKDGDAEPGHV